MQNLLSRRSGPMALVLTLLAAVVIGCGGGGGGGGNGSGSADSGSNADGSTNVSTNGSSAGTDGGVGSLPQDSIFYVESVGTTFDVKYTKADGTGQGTYATGVANENSPMVANPATAGEFVFALIPSGQSTYGIYRNTSVSTVGATTIVSPRYSSVSSLQISRDGSQIIYLATVGSSDFRLYQSPSAAGSLPANLDDAFYVSLSSAGDRVVYNKFPTSADNDTEIYVRKLSDGTTTRLTTNNLFDEDPQFNKDGTKVVFSQQVPSSTRYRLASINLADGVLTTLDPSPTLQSQRAPSLNLAGNRISYVGTSNGNATESGLFVADFPSGANAAQVVSSADLRIGTYWSTPTGRSIGAARLGLSISGRK